MFFVYIIFSKKLNRYYTGSTDNIELRFEEHNNSKYDDAFTKKGIPWELVLEMNELSSKQAYLIEKHIKKMKSKAYIMNLIKYPEMQEKLRVLYENE